MLVDDADEIFYGAVSGFGIRFGTKDTEKHAINRSKVALELFASGT